MEYLNEGKEKIIGEERFKELQHWNVGVSFMYTTKLLRLKTGIVLEKIPMHQGISSMVNVWSGGREALEITTMRHSE